MNLKYPVLAFVESDTQTRSSQSSGIEENDCQIWVREESIMMVTL